MSSDALLFAGNSPTAGSGARGARVSPHEFRRDSTAPHGEGSPMPARRLPRRCFASDTRRRSPQTAFLRATNAAGPIRDTGSRSSSGFPSAVCVQTRQYPELSVAELESPGAGEAHKVVTLTE